MHAGCSWPCLVAVTALVCAALLWSQPATGTVRGVCVDAVSGLPLADANVSLTLKDDAKDQGEAPPTADAENASAGPPLGWTQDSKEDKDVSLSGGSSAKPKTEWRTHTDAQGRFTLSRVRVGEYNVSASTSMHSSDDKHTVVVLEEQAAQITLPLKREESDPELLGHDPGLDARRGAPAPAARGADDARPAPLPGPSGRRRRFGPQALAAGPVHPR